MSKEQATLLGELMMLKAHHPTFVSKIGFVDGKVFSEAEPIEQPFSVKDGEVHMEQAKVDDAREHAIDAAETFRNAFKNYRDALASASAEQSDNLKVDVESIKVEGTLTPDDIAQAYLETISEPTGPSSDIVISIGTLNVKVN